MDENANNPYGKPWDEQEVALIVSDYFKMLTKELSGTNYVKAEHNRQIQALTGRTKKSVEYKYQNVSAVLDILGCPFIFGYKPKVNFQHALIEEVEKHLAKLDWTKFLASPFESEVRREPNRGFDEIEILRDIPQARERTSNENVERLIRKFDPITRDFRMREIGRLGEEHVYHSERKRLQSLGRTDLAKKVRWVAQVDGDGAGYDILSFNNSGEERFLEVKSTIGGEQTPFYISSNEKLFADEHPDHARIYRLFDLPKVPKAFIVTPPLENDLIMTPQSYRATLR